MVIHGKQKLVIAIMAAAAQFVDVGLKHPNFKLGIKISSSIPFLKNAV